MIRWTLFILAALVCCLAGREQVGLFFAAFAVVVAAGWPVWPRGCGCWECSLGGECEDVIFDRLERTSSARLETAGSSYSHAETPAASGIGAVGKGA